MSKAFRATGAAIAGIALGLVGITVFAGAASATDPVCQTSTTTLTNRSDSGFHGDWAKDNITRTVKLCETTIGVGDVKSTYTATVTDTGTFTTIAGKSPGAGVNLVAGITGNLTGGYTATFLAVPAFANYQHVFDGNTYSGNALSTTDWVKNLWGGEDFTGVTNLVGWKWTYWTCSTDVAKATEKWINADPEVNEGDITGQTCPTVAPVVQPKPTATASPAAVVPVAQPSLPITGVSVPAIVTTGIIVLAIGGFAIFFTRRRKTN